MPKLTIWRHDRLKHPILLLNEAQQVVVEQEIERHCAHRGWHVWSRNARSNHVHVVVGAPQYDGKIVRDQLKANATRGLREHWERFHDRPVLTTGGDWQCINTEEELHAVVFYANEAQDRKELDNL